MPLVQGSSQKAVSENIRRLSQEIGKSPHVQSRQQAIAIAMDTARRNKRARGGPANGFDTGGAVQDVIAALRQGSGTGASDSGSPAPNSLSAPSTTSPATPAAPAAPAPMTGASAPVQGAPTMNQPAPPAPMVLSPVPGTYPNMGSSSGVTPPAQPANTMGAPSGVAQNTSQVFGGGAPQPQEQEPLSTPTNPIFGGAGPAPEAPSPVQPGFGGGTAPQSSAMSSALNTGGVAERAAGGANMAVSPNLQPSWSTKQEARLMMHTGPILSAVPGRTDNHPTKVPSGSYVLPAQHLAAMGRGNSVAGLSMAQNLFGPSGPYGAGGMKIAHGRGAPSAPRALASGGHSGYGPDDHKPVDVMLSGGEYVIPPQVVRAIGKGSLKNGHSILDAYVMETRKRDIAVQRKLPPPVKK